MNGGDAMNANATTVAGSIAANRARYLSGLTLAELAVHVGAVAGECSHRGIPVSVELGTVQARIEARAEMERTVAMVTACERGQQGGGDSGWPSFSEAADTPIVLPRSDDGIDGAYPLPEQQPGGPPAYPPGG
jgi:hypothetical protein